MRIPNFFAVGTFKGGTTTICHYLKQHPDVYMCTPKEPRFFAYDPTNIEHTRASLDTYPIRTESEYLKLLRDATNEIAIGEASPIYLNSEIASKKYCGV